MSKAIVLGALTAGCVVIGLMLIVAYQDNRDSQIQHTAEITIAGKICKDVVLGTTVSKIQGDDGLVYFIPNEDCELYPVGRKGIIFYQHICNMRKEDEFCFNRTVGDYI